MGRAKLNMELISKEKTRNITFQKRKSGLLKKAYEFTTLCDVSTCVIIYGPNSSEPEIWPNNPDEVKRLINIYKDKRSDGGKRTFDLSDFFEDRKKKIEDELAKARRRNMEAKYPTWFDFLNNLNEGQLREFVNPLDRKLEAAKSRIEFLKGNDNDHYFQGFSQLLENKNIRDVVDQFNGDNNNNYLHGLPLGLGQSGLDLENMIDDHLNNPIQYPTHHHQDQVHLPPQINFNPMMMLMTGENDFLANMNNPPYSNVQYAPVKRDVCYDSMCGMIDNSHHVVYNNPSHMPTLMGYIAAPSMLQPLPPSFMQYTMVPNDSQLHGSQVNDQFDGDAEADYQMNSKRGRYK